MTTETRLRDRIPPRVLIGGGGLLLAIAFITGPSVLVWWVRLFV
jgi:hypothetical protein